MVTLPNLLFAISAFLAIICINSVSNAWERSSYTRTNNPKHRMRRDATESSEGYEDIPISPRIVGGRPARFGEAPYQVRIESYGGFRCGGSILDLCGFKFVLTAAHCIWDITGTVVNDTKIPLDQLYIIAADLKQYSWQPREQWFRPAEMVSHEDWDPRFFINDVALIRTDRYMFESLGLEPIDLPSINWQDPEYCAVSGWGSYDHRAGMAADELQYVELPVMDWNICKKLPHYGAEFLAPTQFCLGNTEGHLKGTCDGDSGGPAVAYNWTLQKWYLAGMVSYHVNGVCGDRWSASTLSRITNYADWIKGRALGWLERYGRGNPYNNHSLCAGIGN